MSEIDDMKNRRITIGKGRTISIGKFESRRIDISVQGDIPDGSDIDQNVMIYLIIVTAGSTKKKLKF